MVMSGTGARFGGVGLALGDYLFFVEEPWK